MMSGEVESVPHEHYHLLAQGELPADWAGWFNDGTVASCVALGGHTVLDVLVPDQSALLAVLNRLRALHLPLLLLVRLSA